MTIRKLLLYFCFFCFCLISVSAQPTLRPTVGADLPPALQARLHALASQRRGLQAHAAIIPTGGTSALIQTIAGSAPFQHPVKNALQTGLGAIGAIAEDAQSNLYVAVWDLGTVLKMDSSGQISIFAGQPLPTGPYTQSGDGGPATAARIPGPWSLAIDANGNVYIGDVSQGTIREVNAKTGIIQTIAGIPGQTGTISGDGGPATKAILPDPNDMALDNEGNLYFADGFWLRRVNLSTGIIQTVAGGDSTSPTLPNCKLTATNTCPAMQMQGGIYHVATVPGYVYVGLGQDSTDASEPIAEIDTSTWTARLVAGGDPREAGTSATYPAIGTKIQPLSLVTDALGNLYFSDASSYQVKEMLATDHTLHAVAGTGANTDSGDGGAATAAGIALPSLLCLSPTRGIDVVDVFRIRSFTVGGTITTTAGNGYANDYGDNGPATSAGLDQPSAVISDSEGNLYVSEAMGGLIRRIDAHTGIITTIAGSNHWNVNNVDGGPATAAGLSLLSDLALDEAGHRLFLGSDYAIRAVDLNTGILSTIGGTFYGSSTSGGMAFDGSHTLYIGNGAYLGEVSNSEVTSLDTNTGATTVIAGYPSNTGPTGPSGSATAAYLYQVSSLALDGKGDLYIADYDAANVSAVNLSTGTLQPTAGYPTTSPYPVRGYSGDGGPAVDALLNSPNGLAFDGSSNLTINDLGNGVLRQVDLTTGIITTLAGSGSPGFSGDGGPASNAMFNFVTGVAYDSSGNLYIADTYNNRIRRIVLHPTKLQATIAATNSGSGNILTATYSGLSFGIAPTGTITFLVGGTVVGTGTLAAATDGSGTYVTSISTDTLLSDGAMLTAQYAGDANYAALSTTATFQTPVPSYTLSANPTSLTIKQGASGSITFSVTPVNGFQQTVSFSCDNTTLPKGVTCSFTPASVTPNGSAAVTSTLSVQTTAATTAASTVYPRSLFGWLPRSGAMLALLLFGIPRARRRAWQFWIFTVLFAVCFAGALGCGGNSSNGGGTTQNANATPVGAYSVQIKASAGTGTTAIAQPLTVSITVTQ